MKRTDHYAKKCSRFIEDECLPNEVRISSAGKPRDLAKKVVKVMKNFPKDGVVISASGGHVTKAVTTVELVKRSSELQQIHQETMLKYARVEDMWEPDMQGLDTLKVVRRIPAISITLREPAPQQTT